jgi:hypothetical protein
VARNIAENLARISWYNCSFFESSVTVVRGRLNKCFMMIDKCLIAVHTFVSFARL